METGDRLCGLLIEKIPGVSSNAFPGTAKPSERVIPHLPKPGFERLSVFPTHTPSQNEE